MFLFLRTIKMFNLYCLRENSLGVYVCIEHTEDGKHITEVTLDLVGFAVGPMENQCVMDNRVQGPTEPRVSSQEAHALRLLILLYLSWQWWTRSGNRTWMYNENSLDPLLQTTGTLSWTLCNIFPIPQSWNRHACWIPFAAYSKFWKYRKLQTPPPPRIV